MGFGFGIGGLGCGGWGVGVWCLGFHRPTPPHTRSRLGTAASYTSGPTPPPHHPPPPRAHPPPPPPPQSSPELTAGLGDPRHTCSGGSPGFRKSGQCLRYRCRGHRYRLSGPCSFLYILHTRCQFCADYANIFKNTKNRTSPCEHGSSSPCLGTAGLTPTSCLKHQNRRDQQIGMPGRGFG